MAKKLFFLYEMPLPKIEGEVILVSLNDRVSDELRERKLDFRTTSNYNIKTYFMPREAFLLHKKIGDAVIDGKSVREHLTYGGFCLWDNIQYNFCSYLYEHRHLRLKVVDAVKVVLEAEKPDEVFLQTKNSIYGRAIVDVALSLKLTYKSVVSFSKTLELFFSENLQYRAAFYIKKLKRKQRKLRANQEAGHNYDILMPLLMPSFVSIAKPVVLELEKNGFKILLVSVEESVYEKMADVLKKEKLTYRPIEYYANDDVYKNVNSKYNYFLRGWKKISSDKVFLDGLVYHGINVRNTVQGIFDFYFVKRKRIFDVLFFFETFKHLLDLEKPKLILTLSESADTTRPVLEYSKNFGIKSVFLQHGIAKDTPVYREILADALAVWGIESKKEYIMRGVDPKKIFVVGMPKLDSIKNVVADKERICNTFGLDNKKKIFLYLTQPHQKITNERITKILFEGIKDFDANIVLKLHPREKSAFIYESIAKEVGIKIFSTSHNLYELVNISDVVFGSTSSAGLEVLALGKPLIVINLSEQKSRNIYAGGDAVLSVSNPDEVKEALSSLGNKKVARKLQEARKDFLKQNVYRVDGKASGRFVELIKKIIK